MILRGQLSANQISGPFHFLWPMLMDMVVSFIISCILTIVIYIVCVTALVFSMGVKLVNEEEICE